ncbi:aminopeptidase-like protein [Sporomusaceae bacterium BoRhaA]|uniref:DUF4910 domain-containing protein n=1 Tax=Pelorhabdus rhamnosifermentans TaxID=2772457 RepID=UPI001C0636CF|nr:DUF4910 domain-containing protein [Pelorhabdus rhamnosifermentans]MBU2699196.1 aminopeptidase-like protein [Pelorhabdus rhamnosifermentans]
MQQETEQGKTMYELLEKLFPICRSITGNGFRESLKLIQQQIPVGMHEVPSGTKVFDWTVPKEWNIRNAYIEDEAGHKIIDFKKNNLHIVGYSVSVDKVIDLEELQSHLYSLEHQPDAIPYVTSYYNERWGFCLTQQQRDQLVSGKYHVYIDSELKQGSLTYGELIIPGRTEQEIFLSTYLCHPSMANNELSGPVVTTNLAKWLASAPRKYTYRIIFIPETIGSLTYLSRNIEAMKRNIVAGFNVTCVGDERAYSFVPSRYGKTLADKVALHVLQVKAPEFVRYTYLHRGSDERQYCAPGVDLPVVCVMRSKYGNYPEYHTSLDNLSFVTPQALQDSFELLRDCIELLERNERYQVNCLGEPQLGKRGLYPTLSAKGSYGGVYHMMNFLAYADGTNDLMDISQLIGVPVSELYPIVDKLLENKIISPNCFH